MARRSALQLIVVGVVVIALALGASAEYIPAF